MSQSDKDKMMILLFTEDPMGLSKYEQEDEYELEADMILQRIRQCKNIVEIQQIVYQVFVETFDAELAGPVDTYYETAVAIWVDRVGLDKETIQ